METLLLWDSDHLCRSSRAELIHHHGQYMQLTGPMGERTELCFFPASEHTGSQSTSHVGGHLAPIFLFAIFGLNDLVVLFCFNSVTSNCGSWYAECRALCPGPSSQEDRTLAARSKKKTLSPLGVRSVLCTSNIHESGKPDNHKKPPLQRAKQTEAPTKRLIKSSRHCRSFQLFVCERMTLPMFNLSGKSRRLTKSLHNFHHSALPLFR